MKGTRAIILFVVISFHYSCTSDSGTGCTCVASINYDANADEDDGSCRGCTDESSDNYNTCASVDDGSCETGIPDPIAGCTDPNATNFDATASSDNGSCKYPELEPPSEPPFFGTIFLDPDIITASDPTTFTGLTPAGQGSRVMFDRRVNDFITLNAFLFDATFDDGLTTEIQVNPEFETVEDAQIEAEKYANAIGRLTSGLRQRVKTVWIHKGVEAFGGGNDNILIHTGQSLLYEADGILEETLVHEATHTSIDPDHKDAPGWLAAQQADPTFISTYAQDNPTREDLAESYLLFIAVRYRRDRITDELANQIIATFPNRMAYFSSLELDMHPIE